MTDWVRNCKLYVKEPRGYILNSIKYDGSAPPFFTAFVPYILLNLADISLTKVSLDVAGAIEANPIMAAMFESSFLSAVMFKAAAVLLVGFIAYKLWNLSYIRTIISAATWVMASVIVYQMIGIIVTT